MKILICGLPGAGKTYLTERVVQYFENYAWYNADAVRKMANDWDFTEEGRVRQALRMMTIADFESSKGRTVFCDFVAPTRSIRKIFEGDIVIWVDTIKEGRFEDTNKMFEPPMPDEYDFHILGHLTDFESLANDIKRKIERLEAKKSL